MNLCVPIPGRSPRRSHSQDTESTEETHSFIELFSVLSVPSLWNSVFPFLDYALTSRSLWKNGGKCGKMHMGVASSELWVPGCGLRVGERRG